MLLTTTAAATYTGTIDVRVTLQVIRTLIFIFMDVILTSLGYYRKLSPPSTTIPLPNATASKEFDDLERLSDEPGEPDKCPLLSLLTCKNVDDDNLLDSNDVFVVLNERFHWGLLWPGFILSVRSPLLLLQPKFCSIRLSKLLRAFCNSGSSKRGMSWECFCNQYENIVFRGEGH